jgi:hypothetical protein
MEGFAEREGIPYSRESDPRKGTMRGYQGVPLLNALQQRRLMMKMKMNMVSIPAVIVIHILMAQCDHADELLVICEQRWMHLEKGECERARLCEAGALQDYYTSQGQAALAHYELRQGMVREGRRELLSECPQKCDCAQVA